LELIRVIGLYLPNMLELKTSKVTKRNKLCMEKHVHMSLSN